MKKYMVLVSLEIDLGECVSDAAAAEVADQVVNDFMDGYIVADSQLYEIDDDGVRVRGVVS